MSSLNSIFIEKFKCFRTFVIQKDWKWREEKNYSPATRKLIEEFWTYLISKISSETFDFDNLAKSLTNVTRRIKKILEQECSTIEKEFQEILTKRIDFLKSIGVNIKNFDPKISEQRLNFYCGRVYEYYKEILKNERSFPIYQGELQSS